MTVFVDCRRFAITASDAERLSRGCRAVSGATVVAECANLTRILFRIPTGEGRRWLRLRTGDVGESGEIRSDLTVKSVSAFRDETTREGADSVLVSSFVDCKHVLIESGLELVSTQETRREKLIVPHAMTGDRFEVTIDEWPLLDALRAVSVRPARGADLGMLGDFCESHGLLEESEYVGGVDQLYMKEFKVAASAVRDLRFGTAPPAPE